MLDDRWLEIIFSKLTLTYPNRFPPRGITPDLLRGEWARELAGLDAAQLKHALVNLPTDFPPSAAQVRTLALSRLKLVEPPPPREQFIPDPAKLSIAKALVTAFDAQKGPSDPLRWARNLRRREESGDSLTPVQKQAWREALRLEIITEQINESEEIK